MQKWISLNYARDMSRAISLKYKGDVVKEFKYILNDDCNSGLVLIKRGIEWEVYGKPVPSRDIDILVEVVEKVVDFNLDTPCLPVYYSGQINSHLETLVVEWHYIENLKQVAILLESSSTLHLVPMSSLYMKEAE